MIIQSAPRRDEDADDDEVTGYGIAAVTEGTERQSLHLISSLPSVVRLRATPLEITMCRAHCASDAGVASCRSKRGEKEGHTERERGTTVLRARYARRADAPTGKF